MNKRITRKLSDVVADVKISLAAEHNITTKDLEAFRARVDGNGHQFPVGSTMVPIDDLWIDYEVQRDVIIKHIIKIIKRYDPRLCGPVSACKITKSTESNHALKILTYDGQHRTISTACLGFTHVPCNIVETDDPSFPSYAFEELNETGVKKLLPGDLHRNALTRYRLGSTEQRNVNAFILQTQFDNALIDLEDKNTRKSPNLRGDRDYFFSHFKYAYKGIALDQSGKTLFNIINAIRTVFPLQEEIDQGIYIGLYELARLDQNHQVLPKNWMITVLEGVKQSFSSSATVHSKAKRQWEHINPGSTWSAPAAMANFIREVYIMNGGRIKLPYHGEGAKMQVQTNPVAGLFPTRLEAV